MAPSRSERAHSPMNIVVVDDTEDSADMLAELLAIDGHSVKVAYSGTQALELVAAAPPQLVFLDIGLPDMDGYEVAASIRRRVGPGVRLVALTGYSGGASRERAELAGFDAFLVKPVGMKEIRTALEVAERQ